ncbi:MAG TPA: GNAT family N-acetyltransferase [Mycobacteriales bacterium]
MPDDLAELLSGHAGRLRELDPLVGATEDAPPGADVLAAGRSRGWPLVVDLDPADQRAVWSRLRTYALTLRWTGDVRELDELLTRWAEWMRKAGSEQAGPDSQTSVTWPSRDVDAARVFYAHGMMPSTTIAIRPRGRAVSAARPPSGVTIRPATAADTDAVLALAAEEFRYDQGLSTAGERPGHEGLRRQEMAGRLGASAAWAWLAERDGVPVGVLAADRPEDALWVGPMTSSGPAAYVSLLSVEPGSRGGGIGAALAAAARRTFDDAACSASLLHYSTFNPLSAPFWARNGYRPLWTVWATEPASAQR